MKQEILDMKREEASLDSRLAQEREEIHLMLRHLSKWDIEAHHTIQDDFYEVPLSTFWWPVDLCDNIETNYNMEKFKKDFVDDIVNGKVK